MDRVRVTYMLRKTNELLVARSLARRAWHRRLVASASGAPMTAAAMPRDTALLQGPLRTAA